jgi:predicted transcriptional regulator
VLSSRIGHPENAQRFTVNLSAEIAAELRAVATRHRVSESSIVEIALRQLLRRVSASALGAYLREHGACLRRRS